MTTPDFIPQNTPVRLPGFAELVASFADADDAMDALYDFEKEQRTLRFESMEAAK